VVVIKSKVMSVSVFSNGINKLTKVKVKKPDEEVVTTKVTVTHNVSKGKVIQIVSNELGIPPNELEVPEYINRSLPIKVNP